MLWLARVLVLLALTGAPATAETRAGRLVIAGGALSPDTKSVWHALLEGLTAEGRVAVIPGASGAPAQALAGFVETLGRHGVPAGRIDGVRLAMVDDPSTSGVDEAAWSSNASDVGAIDTIKRAEVIWLTGGDQARLADMLLLPDGGDTPMLGAIRARLAAGATVGGSSAGAAAMSCTMIARGDSLPALMMPVVQGRRGAPRNESGALVLERGLCLVKAFTTDQHFDAQARLGRLVRAVAAGQEGGETGIGIDENTALIVDLARDEATVEGAASVVVVDASNTSLLGDRSDRLYIRGVSVSVLTAGDRLNLSTGTITPASFKTELRQAEADSDSPDGAGVGLGVPPQTLERLLGAGLVDNRRAVRLDQPSFDAAGRGVRFVFSRSDTTGGALGRDAAGDGRYTLTDVDLAVTPIRVRIMRR